MRSSTKSLLVTLGTVAAIAVTPLVLDNRGGTADGSIVSAESLLSDSAASDAVQDPTRQGSVDTEVVVGTDATPLPAQAPADGAASPARPGSGMGGDLPPEYLPAPPHPQCPITEAGAWWTDPADPYTCIRPGSMPFHEPTPPGIDPELLKPIVEDARPGSVPFHEPTPPGIDPELLKPIFEAPSVEPVPGADCRTSGALQCTVTVMGQDYVLTFSDGKPVGVAEAR